MRLVLFFLLLSFSLFTKSQNIENFYSADGLVSDFITCIDTDNSGNILMEYPLLIIMFQTVLLIIIYYLLNAV